MRLSRTPVDPTWLDAQLAELERLVERGVGGELVAALDRIVSEPRRSVTLVQEAGAASGDAHLP